MNCPDCKAAMKPLFNGMYCPNDCDKPELKAKKIAEAQDAVAKPRSYVNYATIKKAPSSGPYVWNWGGVPVPPPALPPDDQCRDAMCRGKGTVTHTVSYSNWTAPRPPDETYYQCSICAKQWSVQDAVPTNVVGIPDPSLWN